MAWVERLISEGFEEGELVIRVGPGGGVRFCRALQFSECRQWSGAELVREVARRGSEG